MRRIDGVLAALVPGPLAVVVIGGSPGHAAPAEPAFQVFGIAVRRRLTRLWQEDLAGYAEQRTLQRP